MRKYLLIITMALGITLSGCYLDTTDNASYLTQSELDSMIDDAVDEAIEDAQLQQISDLSDEELRLLLADVFPESEVTTTFDLASFEEAVNDMLVDASNGVLGIQVTVATTDGVAYGTGSGVVYKKELSSSEYLYDYYLVTNDHVIEDADSIILVYEKNGLLFQISDTETELLGSDPQTDLAVVKFSTDEEFTVIEFADSYALELGDFVFAVGNPLGFDYYGTVTMGVLSGLSRYYSEDESVGQFDATVIQHDASISPGNSGGALLDINGDLIGINFMKIVADDVTGIGFAIPSNTVKRIVADLEDDGLISSPYLGIHTYAQINDCGLDYGVCLSDVTAGLAAEAAGLQADDVIVGYMNEEATEFMDINNFNDLREAILNSSVGETVTIKYIRDGEEFTTTATLTEKD